MVVRVWGEEQSGVVSVGLSLSCGPFDGYWKVPCWTFHLCDRGSWVGKSLYPTVPQEGLVLLSKRGHIRMDVRSGPRCSAAEPSAISSASPSRYPQHLVLCRFTTHRLPMSPCPLRMQVSGSPHLVPGTILHPQP